MMVVVVGGAGGGGGGEKLRISYRNEPNSNHRPFRSDWQTSADAC